MSKHIEAGVVVETPEETEEVVPEINWDNADAMAKSLLDSDTGIIEGVMMEVVVSWAKNLARAYQQLRVRDAESVMGRD